MDGGRKLQSSTCNFTNKNGEGTFSVVCVGFVIAAGITSRLSSQILREATEVAVLFLRKRNTEWNIFSAIDSYNPDQSNPTPPSSGEHGVHSCSDGFY